jgi:ribosomal protein S12 methylthiotransferase accessory factor
MNLTEGPVAVIGSGCLFEALAETLPAPRDVVCLPTLDVADLADCAALIVVSDGWDTSSYQAVHRAAAQERLPWLPIRAELGHVVIGPTTVPGSPGCHWCAQSRRTTVRDRDTAFETWWERHHSRLAAMPAPRLNVFACDTVATVVTDEVAGSAERTRNAMVYVDLETLDVAGHPFLPVPGCATCGRLPEDNAELARITLRPRPTIAPGSYRTRDLAADYDQLMATYVDAECGLVRAVVGSSASTFPVASAECGGPAAASGYGRAWDYHGSRITALAEFLERYGGLNMNRRAVVRASYRQIADQAVDPRTLGLYPEESLQQPDFPYHRYDEDLEITWVWGYSFGRSEPVLVPQQCAFYGPRNADKPRFVSETSSGCALGGCMEEAILYGLLEVIERDAFLMTWYGRMPVPELDLSSVGDPAIDMLVQHTEALGYRLHAFNITLQQRIPSFWAMAVDAVGGPERPKTHCAAASHIVPQTGLLNALFEVAPAVHSALEQYQSPDKRHRAARLINDPTLVRKLDDHPMTYYHPAAFDRFDFLFSARDKHDFAEYRHSWAWPEHNDLTDALNETLSRMLDTGLDVVVVDHTVNEHHAGGFSCVKVIVPGLIPMTFGHHERRTHGLPRLLEVPRQLGYRKRDLDPSDLNRHPHPFA